MQQHIVFSISSNKKFAQWPHSHIPRGLNPRSRGENPLDGVGLTHPSGSSPLTRGKLSRPGTKSGTGLAHPRSRGENYQAHATALQAGGSSPLTRGKRVGVTLDAWRRGLIPAHAGKTCRRRTARAGSWAHPRSRGENGVSKNTKAPRAGSSPLTRGKHDLRDRLSPESRLIPAHAGKTGVDFNEADVIGGSSPLTRGKHRRTILGGHDARLIPAHAGKTS